jgi:DNA-binding MarR family transcriptional regulator
MASEPEQLGWLIKRIQFNHHRALDKNLAALQVSLVQWNALREVDRNPGCSQHQLAERTFNSDQAFGTLLTRLAAAGWVEQRPGIGRALTHQLTPNGKAILRRGQKIMTAVTGTSFASLDEHEKQVLARLLTQIINAQESSAI